MEIKNSHSVFVGSKHINAFQFLSTDDYDDLLALKKDSLKSLLTDLSTDIAIIRDLLYILPGSDLGLVKLNNVMRFLKYEQKKSESYCSDFVMFTKHPVTNNNFKNNTLLEIDNGLIRIDKFLHLSFEWWLPKDSFVSASEQDDGYYKCYVNEKGVNNIINVNSFFRANTDVPFLSNY